MKKKIIPVLQLPSLKKTPNNVAVSIALQFCQRKFYGVSKVFLEGYLKDFQWQHLSVNGVYSWQKRKKKKGAVALEWCQKWRKTKHLGFSHHHSRELSIWKKWEHYPLPLDFFNRLSHDLTMHAFFFHTTCSWIRGYWQNNRAHGTFYVSFPSKKHQWIGWTCLRLQTWCSG